MPPTKARNRLALKEVNLKKLLDFRKENIPDTVDLTENLSKYNQNKIDLKLFEVRQKTPTVTASITDPKKSQHVFAKPSIPSMTTAQSLAQNKTDENFSFNELEQINRMEHMPAKSQPSLYNNKPNNNMQINSGYSQTGSYHPAASIMNSLNKSNGIGSGSGAGGVAGGMNSNQQYFAKLNERKYIDPPASRSYKRRKEEDDEEEDMPSKSDTGSSSDQANLPFKSARDQLLIDGAKKNGQQAPQQYNYNQGSQAKRPMTNMPS